LGFISHYVTGSVAKMYNAKKKIRGCIPFVITYRDPQALESRILKLVARLTASWRTAVRLVSVLLLLLNFSNKKAILTG
jgi:hypothetical protein